MKWEQTKYGSALLMPMVSATIRESEAGWICLIASSSLTSYSDTEQEAKEWAEARMNEIKKEFILSLITQPGEGVYSFGNLVDIIGGYHGLDIWTVYHGDNATYKGTLEECKNYIVSCF